LPARSPAAGCHELQGFLFAKPCTPAQFEERLKIRAHPAGLRAAFGA
jgi:EAL domain-containing protein (putative c-di-GMP-specific phosphodiesterase class I)